MFKGILITTGLLLLLVLAGFWIYLLFFGTPQSVRQIFTNFGQNEPAERPLTNESVLDPDQLDISKATLEQLTTRPVAGYISTGEVLLYAERGTGHVYRIDFNTGLEERVQSVTLAKTVGAIFSGEGDSVILVSESEALLRASFYEINGENDTGLDLPPNSANYTLIGSTTILYTRVISNNTVAYSFDKESLLTKELWRIPLTDVNVYFVSGKTFVVNRPSAMLRGAVYEVVNGELVRRTAPQLALTAKISPDGQALIYNYYNAPNKSLLSEFVDLASKEVIEAPLTVVPEKCGFAENGRLWCGESDIFSLGRQSIISDWYKGTATSDDQLWEVATREGQAIMRLDLKEESGFVIDTIDLEVSPDGKRIFFVNKLNDTLWMYRMPKSSSQ